MNGKWVLWTVLFVLWGAWIVDNGIGKESIGRSEYPTRNKEQGIEKILQLAFNNDTTSGNQVPQ